jgi:transcriptional regulator with PAS, ATPase and Fis domain
MPEGNARASTRRLLAHALVCCDRADEAQRVAEEAARIAHTARAPSEHALAELAISEVVRSRGDFVASLRHAARARALALRAHDAPVLRSVLADFGLLLSRLGDGERAREVLDEALGMPSEGQPAHQAFRVLYNAAAIHRTAGRYDDSLRLLDRAEALAETSGLGVVAWSVGAARLRAFIDIGAVDLAEKALALLETREGAPAWQRAHHAMYRAMIAHASGERPELVERYASEGLAIEGLEMMTRVSLERLRALGLLGRGRVDDAERVAVSMVSLAGKGGAQALAAQSMALAARCGRPDAALLRWLGAYALGSNGAAARVEHEAIAALTTEPDPIGMMARTAVGVIRARLLARTPAALRGTMKRTLRTVEAKMAQTKHARRVETETTLGEDVLRAKEEIGIVGSSPPILRALATLARAAKSDSSLVISGETGSGKELFARLAHRLSPRASGPFVAVNCAALPEPLLEGELFGHERGAFTGAERSRPGLFVEAHGGTLFLDEVGEMSAAMQAKLLRVIEEREVRALGGSRARKVDVRVLGATHRDLQSMVTSRAFREDLYYRLAAITVRVPSLRERTEDVPVIARAILARDPTTANLRIDVPGLTTLAEHAWPGNVRELSNVLRVAAAHAENGVVSREELTLAIEQGPRSVRQVTQRALDETTLAALRARHKAELRELVGRAIAAADGNKLRAAHALGISRQGLYRVLDEFEE